MKVKRKLEISISSDEIKHILAKHFAQQFETPSPGISIEFKIASNWESHDLVGATVTAVTEEG